MTRERPTLAALRALQQAVETEKSARTYAEREADRVRAELFEAKRGWASAEEKLREARLDLARERASNYKPLAELPELSSWAAILKEPYERKGR